MPRSTVSVALVGAGSLLGREIVRQLAESGFPGDSVSLLDLEEIAGMLIEYGEEARIMLDAATEDLLQHDVVCFCGDANVAREQLDLLLEHDRIAVDCTGAWSGRTDTVAWLPGAMPTPSLTERRAITLPGAPAIALGATLTALGERGNDAVATVLLPASESGEPGLQELSQQCTAVLNLENIDEEVFGRQRAFDLWLAGEADGAQRIGNELRDAGLPVPRIEAISAPVFHGLAIALFLPGADADTARTAFEDARIAVGPADEDGDPIDSPVRSAGTNGISVASIREDGDGAWLWLVIDNLNARAAVAVTAIHALLGPVPTDPPATV